MSSSSLPEDGELTQDCIDELLKYPFDSADFSLFDKILELVAPFENLYGPKQPESIQPEAIIKGEHLESFYLPSFPFRPEYKIASQFPDEDLRNDRNHMWMNFMKPYLFEDFDQKFDEIEKDYANEYTDRKKWHIEHMNEFCGFVQFAGSGKSAFYIVRDVKELNLYPSWCTDHFFMHPTAKGFLTAPPYMYKLEIMDQAHMAKNFKGFQIKAPKKDERDRNEANTSEQRRTDPRQSVWEKWVNSRRKTIVGHFLFDPKLPPGLTEAAVQPGQFRRPYNFKYFNEWEGYPFLSKHYPDLRSCVILFGKAYVEGVLNLLLFHWKEIVCGGSQESFEYEVKFVASKFTHPDRKMDVALVTVGEKGAGKTMMWQFLASLFGNASLYLQSPRQLTEGKFGLGSLGKNKVVLVCDEIKVKGSIEEEFKTLITGEQLNSEEKFKTAEQKINRMMWIFTTNDMNSFSSNLIERRMFITQAKRLIPRELENLYFGTCARVFSDPKAKMVVSSFFFNLSFADQMQNWNQRCFLRTEAQVMMELHSLTTIESWYYTSLKEQSPEQYQGEPDLIFKARFDKFTSKKNGYLCSLSKLHLDFMAYVDSKGIVANQKPREYDNKTLFMAVIRLFTGVNPDSSSSPKPTPPPSRKRKFESSSSCSSISFPVVFKADSFLMPSMEERKKAWIRYKNWDNFY